MQGLELQSIVPVNNGRFEPAAADMAHLPPGVPQLLASCHGLAWLGETLVGDPLDQKLFAASGWSLVDNEEGRHSSPSAAAASQSKRLALVHPPGKPAEAAAIVRRFEFSSQLQRNLVVVQLDAAQSPAAAPPAAAAAPGAGEAMDGSEGASATADLLGDTASGPLLPDVPAPAAQAAASTASGVVTGCPPAASHVLYAKGSPEMIKGLVQASSLPPDFDRVLSEYTREGLRVLALARGFVTPGMLPEAALMGYSQQQLEADVPLELVGLAVLANPLRADTAGAIDALQKAQVRG